MILRVFLSSTSKDLIEEREAVTNVLHEMVNIKPVVMENFTADGRETDLYCDELAGKCDVFILLVGSRYGSVPPGNSLSYTEIEYNAAIKANRDILVFYRADPEPCGESGDLKNSFDRFRKKALENRMAAPFNSPRELALEVSLALHNLLSEGSSLHGNQK